MLDQCSGCNQDAGFFSLQDKLCQSCLKQNPEATMNKLSRVFSFSSFWGIVFVLGFPGHLLLIYMTPRVDDLMDTPPIMAQALFSIVILMLALISALVAFIVRFYLVRRRVHKIVVAMFGFILFAFYSVMVGVAGDGVLGITSLAFIFFPCYMLRTPNISNNESLAK